MGTRADFYVGVGSDAEWIGSIAYDGDLRNYPDDTSRQDEIIDASSEEGFRKAVAKELAERGDATVVSDGWPWPWESSKTTDFAWAYHDGTVYSNFFGHGWISPDARAQCNDDEDPEVIHPSNFPDMSSVQKVAYGSRSGVLIVSVPEGVG